MGLEKPGAAETSLGYALWHAVWRWHGTVGSLVSTEARFAASTC